MVKFPLLASAQSGQGGKTAVLLHHYIGQIDQGDFLGLNVGKMPASKNKVGGQKPFGSTV
jgi:hypothetical protein